MQQTNKKDKNIEYQIYIKKISGAKDLLGSVNLPMWKGFVL